MPIASSSFIWAAVLKLSDSAVSITQLIVENVCLITNKTGVAATCCFVLGSTVLGRLKVGVVGLGGTGSAVVEQLARLGVGELLLCDPQEFESTNVNRVY